MPYEEKCSPSQPSAYFSLIGQCEDLVSIIKDRTSFIQLDKPCAGTNNEVSCGSPLEEKLKGLLGRLEILNNSFKI
jgi:hypothetical protein